MAVVVVAAPTLDRFSIVVIGTTTTRLHTLNRTDLGVAPRDCVIVGRVGHVGSGNRDDLIQKLPPVRRAKVEERALPRPQRTLFLLFGIIMASSYAA
jgi:hypothetical protein